MSDKQIDIITSRLYSMFERGTQEAAERVAERIEDKLLLLQETFFTILSSKMIDKARAPTMGKKSPHWVKLTDKWQQRKVRLGHSKNFYSFQGEMLSQLSDEEAVADFGTPTAQLTIGGKTAQGRQVFKSPSGRGVQATVSGGKFTPLSKIVGDRKMAIVVDAFPDITEDLLQGAALGIERKYIQDENLGYKLSKESKESGGLPLRPVLVPYMQWWLDFKVRSIIKKEL